MSRPSALKLGLNIGPLWRGKAMTTLRARVSTRGEKTGVTGGDEHRAARHVFDAADRPDLDRA